ncbi:MAG TPA: hypothetical protein VNO52_13260 [Methylomirabilota bacterium]|nr:hypothetical protein [Methylomirabilota bacterium]
MAKQELRQPHQPGFGWTIVGLGLATCLAVRADFQGSTHLMPFEEDTIDYNNAVPTDVVAQLQKRIEAGEVRLEFDPRHGYLPSLLQALGIPTSSQMLVFSKTSLQRERISPQTPRALYFNDNVYVGFIPGAPLLEVSTADPKLGGNFYTLAQDAAARPQLVRNTQCLECHASAKSMGVPGHLVRSFATDEQGVIDMSTGTSLVNHRTPLEERWGGWYVTGTHGAQPHRGNLVGKAAHRRQETEPNYLGNVTNLARFLDTTAYPEPGSDIVALMVFEHQTHMHNFITRLNYESTLALRQYGHLNYLRNATEAFLKYLLFVEEAPLTAPVQGRPDFVAAFEARGPRDPQGRSLRQFDLQTRLFRHPCSYLIYSDAFDGLPAPMKEKLYRRLWEILTGADTTPAYGRIPTETKLAILEILAATKPGLPAYWKAPNRSSEGEKAKKS